jgi:2-polyprenyl-6-methoxyphenol hydroxylase-like FAD-dependent oxidoreductase
MGKIGDHAIVLGASMCGLLAARVLADFYDDVTVVERDVLGDDPVNRRGVPQGRHAHALLGRGSHTLAELFPGLLEELVADGAPVWDDGDLSQLYIFLGGHRMVRSGMLKDPSTMTIYFPSRPFLECHVRRRLLAIPNVTMLDGHDVAELTATFDGDRVTGARVVDRDGGGTRSLTADLVVDATGRGSRTPAFLESLGYERPAEDQVVVHLAYASQMLRIPRGVVHEKMVAVGASPDQLTGMALAGYENDTWMFTVGGMMGHEPPVDQAGMVTFAEDVLPAHLGPILRAAEPLGEVARYRVPSNRWRRYDKMRRLPKGLLVSGDAICSFNPVYGQGMTMAALDALVLRDCLRRGGHDLPKRFFASSAKRIGVAWQMATGSDLTLPEVEGRRTRSMRFTNAYTDRVLAAAESDLLVAERFLRAMQLIDPASSLLRPSVLRRAATVGRRRKATYAAPAVHATT